MTTTQPAALLEVFRRLCEATNTCSVIPGLNERADGSFEFAVAAKYGVHRCPFDLDLATDILEARIWRVLREWAEAAEERVISWHDRTGINVHDYVNGWIATGSSLTEAAEAVIAHIESNKEKV